jgi:hypothetical protein
MFEIFIGVAVTVFVLGIGLGVVGTIMDVDALYGVGIFMMILSTVVSIIVGMSIFLGHMWTWALGG